MTNWTYKTIREAEEVGFGGPLKPRGHTVVDVPVGATEDTRLHFAVFEVPGGYSTGRPYYRFAVYQDGRDFAHCSLIVDTPKVPARILGVNLKEDS